MKKWRILILSVVFLPVLALGGAYTVDRYRMHQNKPVIFSTWGFSYAPPVEPMPAMEAQPCFLGTVLEETTSYMLIEPVEGESERTVADKIKIEYETDHIDFLYGLGRRVVIYYDGNIEPSSPPTIRTDDISTEGFRDFSLSVLPSDTAEKELIIRKRAPHDSDLGWHRQYNLYYYGLDEVSVFVDGQRLPLKDAIIQGKITMYALLGKANRDVSDGYLAELVYRDGGSQVYHYPDFTIVKYHTLDGNDDMYICTPGTDIHVKDK